MNGASPIPCKDMLRTARSGETKVSSLPFTVFSAAHLQIETILLQHFLNCQRDATILSTLTFTIVEFLSGFCTNDIELQFQLDTFATW